MDEFVGVIKNFGGTFAPAGWVMCDGRSLQISQNEVLYTLIGTTFGGDGVNTFNVPDLNGSVLLGTGRSAAGTTYNQGDNGGSNDFTMTTATMPMHVHAMTLNSGVTLGLKANGTAASTPEPNGDIPGLSGDNLYAPKGGTPMVSLTSTIAMTNTGNSTPASLDNRTPFMALNFIICTIGLWPTPN